MKKLLSVFLAVTIIFSCCTLAADALYLETVTDTVFADNLREEESEREYSNIGYSNIIIDDASAAKWLANPENKNKEKPWLYTASEFEELYPKALIGTPDLGKNERYVEFLLADDFIEVVTKADPVSESGKASLPLLDSYGRPTEIYKEYEFTKITTKQLEVLGVPVNYIYNNAETEFLWANLNSHPEDYPATDADGNRIMLANVAKADISLMFADINMHLLRIMKSLYSDYRFYTEENAVKCINFLGNLFYSNFKGPASTVFADKDYVYNATIDGVTYYYADEEIFFQKVANLSGLSDLIQSNWIDHGTVASNYKPLIKLLGVTEGTLLNSEYYRGDKIAAAVLQSMFTKIMGEGPLNYFLGVLESLIKSYHIDYYNAIRLLFTQKMSYYDENGKLIETTEEELATITGLLNMVANGNRKGNKNYFQFAPLPEKRLAMIEDKSEFYLTLLVYFNVNAHYLGNNQQLTTNLVSKINALPISDAATTDKAGNIVPGYKTRLVNIIKVLSGDQVEHIFYDGTLEALTTENLSSKPAEYWGNVKEALSRMVKKIADWFQMWIDIFKGDLEFGAGAFE